MADLTLKFTDETGVKRFVTVAKNRFTIGRNADNDLPIASSNLSRLHAQIERFGNIFVLSDCNSSNGTSINNQRLSEPTALKDADVVLLGDAVELIIELPDDAAENDFDAQNNFQTHSEQSENPFLAPLADGSTPLWQNVFFVAPLFGFVALIIIGIVLFSVGRPDLRRMQSAENDREIFESENSRSLKKSRTNVDSDDDEIASANISAKPSEAANNNLAVNSADSNVSSSNLNAENERIERFARIFLREISSDPNPILTNKQIDEIKARIKKLQASPNVNDNLRAARQNTNNFEKTAQTNNLKTKFLTMTALAKMGETRGDALATANALAPDLKKFSNVLGTELANDALLVVAAYSEGGSPLAMRDKVANLTKQTPNKSAATVRTIWFLHENNKISDAAYDFALRFLALGTMFETPPN